MFCDKCKGQAEAIKSDYAEQLGRERNNVMAAHGILTKAGILPAQGVACDDPKCFSHLTHRTHTLVEGRDSLLLQVAALTQQTKDEASAYSSLAKSYEAMKLQISELKAHSERVGAVNQVRWDDYVKATNRADAAERLINEMKADLAEFGGVLLTDSNTRMSNRVQKSLDKLAKYTDCGCPHQGEHGPGCFRSKRISETGCACGATVMDPSHRPGCPLMTAYRRGDDVSDDAMRG